MTSRPMGDNEDGGTDMFAFIGGLAVGHTTFRGQTRNRLLPNRLVPAASAPAHRLPRKATVFAASGKPPAVKSSFYKNPSKAIEKGGGFFIPGLRGPRLRVFVSAVAVSLLTVNHFASFQTADAQPVSFAVSEVLSLIAAASVAVSAYVDLSGSAESDSPSAVSDAKTPIAPQVASKVETVSDAALTELLSWTGRVAKDLTPVEHFTVFDGEGLVFSDSPVSDKRPGKAVMRVAKEDKSIFIADSSALPAGIDFPFLGNQEDGQSTCFLFLVPLLSGRVVVAFSGPSASAKGLSAGDRAWLRQCASRLETSWQ